jgi:hypothetical protein
MAARSQEYWRPADPDVARAIDVTVKEAFCWNCGTPYSAAAAYCQACGSARTAGPQVVPAAGRKTAALRLRLPLGSLVFLIVGLGCFAAALLTGAIYRTDTLVDWQAVQVWRVEWLLAGCGAMLAAIVLRLGHR